MKNQLLLISALIITSVLFGQKIKKVETDSFDGSITAITNTVLLDNSLFTDYNMYFKKTYRGEVFIYTVKLYLMNSSISFISKDDYFKLKLENDDVITLNAKYDSKPQIYSSGFNTNKPEYIITESQLKQIRDSRITVCRILTSGNEYIQIDVDKKNENKTDKTIDVILNYHHNNQKTTK